MPLERVTFADYLAWPAVSCSDLLHLRRSPASAQLIRATPKAPSPAMRFGTAWHCACLEPEEFDRRYIVAGTCVATKKGGEPCSNAGVLYLGGEWFCRVRGHAPEGAGDPLSTVLAPGDHTRIHAMRRSLWAHPKWEDTRSLCLVERSAYGCVDGLEMKARPDLWDAHRGRVIDLKSTAKIEQIKSWNGAKRLDWHIRAAHYLDTLTAAGVRATEYVYAVVASDPPYEAYLWEVTNEQLMAGREEHRRLLDNWVRCASVGAIGAWPGGNTEIEALPMNVSPEQTGLMVGDVPLETLLAGEE